ncbi:hypothetical protein EDB81DRAFT_767334 [Dactylonectria macrodidyma]|uniref:SET domain-containing protein n=1 Tax=Dactylonectria macrodidyma TaxID=307937 RepID=A0A9P9IDW5_9HYPO|nr:hypothetical protein EDB81DRAFT_767334 [Dactylonectria macrodidyma]
MSRGHSYSRLQVPSDAPFKLKSSPGKGWGAFATRHIDRGALILSEMPLFVIRKPHPEITEGDVWIAFQQLDPGQKQQISHLRDNASRQFTSLEKAFAGNSFHLAPQSNELSAHGLFLLQSRFNHSCIPNSKVPTTNGEIITRFATKDIVAGEEITFCYNTDFEGRTGHERHQVLGFACDCRACLPGTPFQQSSDLRRRLVRRLQYLTLGVDLEGQKQSSDSSIIVDPRLKHAAETFSIPLSSRLVYGLLSICLLEEEGLLDDFMVERLSPSVFTAAKLFTRKNNAKIAGLVMKQGTWPEKLFMSFRLYGREDAADHELSKLMSLLRK